jgi:zinc protease
LSPRRLRCALGAATLATLASGCGGGGRDFKAPRGLDEGRPARAVLTTQGAPADESFRATPPAHAAVASRRLPAPVETTLSNGVRVVMLERHDYPSISMVFVLDRGAAAAPPGVATLYASALTGNSAEYEAAEAWQYLDFVGGTIGTATRRDSITMQVTALTPLFVSALSRAAPMFTSPELDGDDLEEARTHLAAERAEEDADPSGIASDALYAAIFPAPHPYGVPVSGVSARVSHEHDAEAEARVASRATDAAVRAFRDGTLAADRVSVACVGDLKPALVLRVLEKALAKLPAHASATPPPFPAPPPPGGRRVIVVDRPGAVQSHVAIGWPGPRSSDTTVVGLDVLAAATAGGLSTRLNITVRKELGASYGVHMVATDLRDGGIVKVTAAVDTSRTVEATRGIFAELARLRTEPLGETELGAAKLRTYHDLERSSTRGLARYLAQAVAEGKPVAYAVAYNARVDTVTADDVRAAAARWLAPEEARVVIVGDAERIVTGLRGLDLGDVTVTTTR